MYAISQSPDSERYARCICASKSVREDIEKALAPMAAGNHLWQRTTMTTIVGALMIPQAEK